MDLSLILYLLFLVVVCSTFLVGECYLLGGNFFIGISRSFSFVVDSYIYNNNNNNNNNRSIY